MNMYQKCIGRIVWVLAIVFAVQAADIAVVAKIIGGVTFQKQGVNTWQPLKMGTLLPADAVIRTAGDGFATILYIDDKSSVKMRPKTELKIGGTKVNGSLDKTVKMSFGESAFQVTKGRQFRVETPTSVASVKGTSFLVIVSSETNTTSIYGITGTVSVGRLDGTGSSQDVTSRIRAMVSDSGDVVRDSISEEEFLNIDNMIKSMNSGDTTIVEGHEVTMKSTNGGGIVPVGKKFALDNIPFEIVATPDSGMYFTGWHIVAGSAEFESRTSAKTKMTIKGSNAVIEGRFAQDVKTAEVTVVGKGKISSTGKFNVETNKPVVITATPSIGYKFSRWNCSPGVTATYPDSSTTEVLFLQNGTINAVFERIVSTLSVTSSEGGAVTPMQKNGFYGDTVTVTATASNNHYFTGWRVTDGSASLLDSGKTIGKVVLKSQTVVVAANFADRKIMPPLNFEQNSTVTCSKPSNYTLNKPFTIRCEARQGFAFGRWEVVQGNCLIADPYSSTTELTVLSAEPITLRVVSHKIQDLRVELKSTSGTRKNVIIEFIEPKQQ